MSLGIDLDYFQNFQMPVVVVDYVETGLVDDFAGVFVVGMSLVIVLDSPPAFSYLYLYKQTNLENLHKEMQIIQ